MRMMSVVLSMVISPFFVEHLFQFGILLLTARFTSFNPPPTCLTFALVFEPFVAGQIAYGKVGHFAIKANWQLMFQGPYNFWMKWEALDSSKGNCKRKKTWL